MSALRRIAFLLERAREDTYKVKAYRAAVTTLSTLSQDEIAARVAAGTLTELTGIGATTAAVITQATRGEVPDRLRRVEEEYGGPLTATGQATRAALRGDLHSHSDWSDGGSPIAEMARTAAELGHDYLVLTDHSPRLKVARGLSAARLAQQLDVIEQVNADLAADLAPNAKGERFRLLSGIEVDILDDGGLDQNEEMLARLDVRVASVHSKLAMPAGAMTARMVAAVESPFTNVLGHCTGRLTGGSRGRREESEFDARAVFEACAAHDVAVEINARPERRDPPTRLLELAIEVGCLFSIDSDAHAPGQLDLQIYGCERAEELGLVHDRIVNTWPIDRLLGWATPKV
ncbi:PHP domain-containing protein [Nocardioides sp.]|uniref:PHP domain-containing protein n=1 Tax=Nocardioides sp. TaxID=35761 RepID=UPI0026228B4E|nr:PHP domain-containing protein [Nocardioides sp.]